MAVRIFLTSGAQRLVADANRVEMDDTFFRICRAGHTVLTLLSKDVIRAQVEDEQGRVTDHLMGTGLPRGHQA